MSECLCARAELSASDSQSTWTLMFRLLKGLVATLGLAASAVTLLSFHKGSHWFIRAWDFPRVQIATLSALSASLFRAFFFRGRQRDYAFLSANLLCVLWQ